MYSSGKALKFTEQDIYQKGCLPDTAQSRSIDIQFSAYSIQTLIEKICEYYGVPKDHLELNACGVDGRIDISVMETDEYLQASKADIELWKQGKKRLWNSTYSYQIVKIVPVRL